MTLKHVSKTLEKDDVKGEQTFLKPLHHRDLPSVSSTKKYYYKYITRNIIITLQIITFTNPRIMFSTVG